MNELIAKKVMGRKPSIEEAPIILNEYANTSSAGSIISFHVHQQNLETGALGLICSLGAGYSIGSVFTSNTQYTSKMFILINLRLNIFSQLILLAIFLNFAR